MVLVPEGYHVVSAESGYDLYYLNVMAGPVRERRVKNHPDHGWIAWASREGETDEGAKDGI